MEFRVGYLVWPKDVQNSSKALVLEYFQHVAYSFGHFPRRITLSYINNGCVVWFAGYEGRVSQCRHERRPQAGCRIPLGSLLLQGIPAPYRSTLLQSTIIYCDWPVWWRLQWPLYRPYLSRVERSRMRRVSRFQTVDVSTDISSATLCCSQLIIRYNCTLKSLRKGNCVIWCTLILPKPLTMTYCGLWSCAASVACGTLSYSVL